MADLRARADELTTAITDHAKAVQNSTAFVKIVLVVGGATIIALAQCATLPSSGNMPVWTIVGLIGTALAFLGGIAMVFTEPSAAAALATAHKTLEDAREAESQYDDLYFYLREVKRATELYGATMLMRKAVERMLSAPAGNVDVIPDILLKVAASPLRLALDFPSADHWTLGVYKMEGEPGARVLRCCAQVRSEECDIKNARAWPEGRGAGWIALANEKDVVIPDVKSPAMGSIFDGTLREEDLDRYRSVAAVPIMLEGGQKWGTVVATCDQEGHFSLDPRPGVRPIEAGRALAGMIALALADHTRTAGSSNNGVHKP